MASNVISARVGDAVNSHRASASREIGEPIFFTNQDPPDEFYSERKVIIEDQEQRRINFG